MQEFELHYQLVKEDYLDWIHWNVGRHSMKKTKIASVIIYIGFLVVYLGGSIITKKEPAVIMSSLVVVLLLGAFMFYLISPRHQERMIWKRSGLQKLEKTNGFPHVNLFADDINVRMEVPGQFDKNYSFAEIPSWEETERLFLLGTTDKTWQFIAKTAFESPEQIDAFRIFMMEKIEDAKENPEKYSKKTSEEQAADDGFAEGVDSSEFGNVEYEEEIQQVDTSNMGKIGKMAHIIAAMSADNDKEAGDETDGDQDSDEDQDSNNE